MVTTHKAIQTRYKNRKFRSRTEARWAVFLDHLGIHWEYEKEGYDLSFEMDHFATMPEEWEGAYLPDFYLPELDTWIEVKGGLPKDHFGMTMAEIKAWCLSKHTGCRAIVFFGPPEYETPASETVTTEFLPRMDRDGYDGLIFFAINADRSKAMPGPSKCAIHNAIRAAMSARFEFGESGAPAE